MAQNFRNALQLSLIASLNYFMGRVINLSGNRYSRLEVLSFSNIANDGHAIWICQCDCGKISKVASNDLKKGTTKSCGCYLNEVKLKAKKHGQRRKGNTSSEYLAWSSMKDRCLNPDHKYFYNYGGRGIKVCDRWLESFENFFEDMGKKPSPKHSLDRFPDNNGNYEKTNCRWATGIEQCGNRRVNKWLQYNGERKIFSDWSIYFKCAKSSLSSYLKRHTFDEAYLHYKNKNGRRNIKHTLPRKAISFKGTK